MISAVSVYHGAGVMTRVRTSRGIGDAVAGLLGWSSKGRRPAMTEVTERHHRPDITYIHGL